MKKFTQKLLVIACGSVFYGHIALAEDEVTVTETDDALIFTANLIKSQKKEVGSSTNVVTETNIHEGQYRSVEEAILSEPGITISKNGMYGPSSIFIRGASGDHALVMVDGIVVNDPISPGNSFDFANLNNLMNIERIEVLKGPQSTLYGSDAMAGVIQIFTKKGKEPETVLSLEGGSYQTYRSYLRTSGLTDTLQYSALIGGENSHGISSAAKEYGNSEKDGLKNRTGSISFNYAPTANLDFDVILRYNRNRNDYDAHGGEGGDDYYLYQRSTHFMGHFAANGYFYDDKLLTTFSYNVSNLHRNTYNDPDRLSAEYERTGYKGKTETYDLRNTLKYYENFNTIIGFTYRKETGKNYFRSDGQFGPSESEFPKKSANMFSAYLEQHLNFGGKFFNTIGVRSDDHSEFGRRATYRITSRYNINDYFSVKGSVGTGFKAPTLYQLYDPSSGNPNLDAERSQGYDLGFIVYPTQDIELGATYFYQKFKKMIDWDDANWKYYNAGEVVTKGVELSTMARINDEIKVGLNYTYLDAKNKLQEERLIRRPRHQVGTTINYAPTEKLNLHLGGTYYSSRLDTNFNAIPSKEVKLRPFWLVNIAASYKVNSRLEVTAKINNVFDKKYSTVYGYGEPRASGYLGVNITF